MVTVSHLRIAAPTISATPSPVCRIVAEGSGTASLITVAIGTGIRASRFSSGDATWTLLAQSPAGGAGLLTLPTALAPVSGAYLNPAIALSTSLRGDLRGHEALTYLAVQIVGVVLGVAAAHVMFGMPAWATGTHAATGPALWWSEALATFGLIGVGMACGRHAPQQLPLVAAAYIAAGYWLTSSLSLANPTLAFACVLIGDPPGIRPGGVPGYMLAQLVGVSLATPLFNWLTGMDAASVQISGITIALV